MNISILIIEDEEKVARYLVQGLQEAGFFAIAVGSGEEGLVQYLENNPELIILDLNLPGRDGLQILATIRKQNTRIPVLILSARATTEDKVRGLDIGADDYLTKPFEFSELLARVKVLLRRDLIRHDSADDHHGVMLNMLTREVQRDGANIELTPKEFEILALLIKNKGNPVSRQVIAKNLWQAPRVTSLDNIIDVHIMRLRKKVNQPNKPHLIHTIRGLGFLFDLRDE